MLRISHTRMKKVMWYHEKQQLENDLKEGLLCNYYFLSHDESQHGLFVRTLFWKSYFKIWGRRVAIGFSFFYFFSFPFPSPPIRLSQK